MLTYIKPLGLSLLLTAYLAPAALSQSGARSGPEEIISLKSAEPSEDIAQLGSILQASPISMVFTSFDSDFDKFVNRAELNAGIDREWASMNPSFRGNVGAINFEDWMVSALGANDAAPTRLSFDTDINGQISKAEFTRRLTLSFEGLDKDDDDALSRTELTFRVARRGATIERNPRVRPTFEERDGRQ